MAWQPVGAAGCTGQDDELRCGTQRSSMRTNVLIAKTPLGKVKKTTFNNAPSTTVYGMSMPADSENARAVTSSWKEHVPNPHAKPGPDFRAINKAAADSGLTDTRDIKTFRKEHPATLKTGVEGLKKAAPELPSDRDPQYTYGRPAGYRSAEEVRNCGPSEPQVGQLIKSAYSHEWTDMNTARQDEFDVRRKYIKPAPTAATEGHALGAQRTITKVEQEHGSPSPTAADSWKMKKFDKTQSKVTQIIHGSNSKHCSPERAHHEHITL
eukprot:GHRR01008925.1.p1 GENE.GHRR01008925.1~~GHRR01008925.1.p1  ORF type:complete len:267 (+),score=76.73 GHRR01008925.1:279-1079(+)